MAASTFVCASSQDCQKPMLDWQLLQMVVDAMGKLRFVSQFRTDLEPRKDRTISLLVVSVATKPVISDLMELDRRLADAFGSRR